ncbi:MAG TPA: GGDEF domain-containing protein [Magnetospirillaceae bacterium]|jgi:GGDEF domain-containing protein
MRGDAHRHAMAEAANDSQHPVHVFEDIANVLGTSDGVIPPAVQARIAALMEEVERLRTELAQARRHEEMLRDLADHHPTLPVHHRRAFLRELTRLVAQAERSAMPGTLVYFHIAGIEALRDSDGPQAAEAALHKVIEILRSETDPADPIAYLDGGDFAVAWAMTVDPEAQSRAQRLADRLANMPFLWNGRRPEFAVQVSRTTFGAGEEADTLLRTTEASRRGG